MARTDLPRLVAHQIAVAAPTPGSGPVELRLNPEELGRVSLSLLQSDTKITVTILAERGDTIDLMRRHIALLESEFREIGFDDIRFAFGSASHNGADPDHDRAEAPDQHDDIATAPPPNAADTPQRPGVLPVTDGLDLRF
jgi:hypothetical protein